MSVKGTALKTKRGQDEDDIEEMLYPVKLLTVCDSLTHKSNSKDICKCSELKQFMEAHAKTSQYCFQLKKCS